MIPYLHKNSKYQPSPLNTDLLERTKVAMNNKNQEEHSSSSNKDEDEHENDVVMPGFRFHPTEEELVEFYLRRKVEGKHFNVELISFLDLYRYDPWELPGLAAIGEKEWYFYVPRDRKYRNGDRPNRVTTSGYWKATGADRMIRSENSRSIGLKKTLVFYSGKAPKGVRTSWIMNEYRLPHHETELLQKAEISLCRVHKRAGVEDDPFLPRSFPTTPRPSSTSSSRVKYNEPTTHQQPMEESSFQPNYSEMSQRTSGKRISDTSPMAPNHTVDDLHKLVSSYSSPPPINHQHLYPNNNVPNLPPNSHISAFQSQAQTETQPMVLNVVPGTAVQGGFSDRMWEWNAISEAGKDSYSNLFM